MCGIAGIVSILTAFEGEASVRSMLKAIEHRGPDSEGLWSTAGFAFGMKRLSIIDLEGGDQPIWSQDGVGIVFNGEIYNFKNLKASLEKDGILFKTHSDTEVILQLYLKRGIEAVQALEGMFGICLYDPRIQKVYLIRDRLGVKPLYYYETDSLFAFGSEIKAILAGVCEKPVIHEGAIWDYLTLRYVPAPQTIWKNIRKLEPGHYLVYDLKDKAKSIVRYWSVSFTSQKISKKRDYQNEFETLFLEAVEKRLLASDVPVGILLSGGLDSSCVAAAAIELGHKNFHTFSIGFEDGGEFNELKYADQVAEFIGSNHHTITMGQKEFIDFIPAFVWHMDEPVADLASIPFYYVSKLAREHVKVVLSGEGSDEILAGYNCDELARKWSLLKIASYIPNFLLKRSPKQALRSLGEHGLSGLLKAQAMHMTSIFTEDEKKSICKFKPQLSTQAKIQSWYDRAESRQPLDQLQQTYCHSWLVEDLLMKADKMSMATSLEVRVPFLDHKLVEWAAHLPVEWKTGGAFQGYTTKKILRDFAIRRIPQNIIDRPKQGFPVPAYHWIQKDLQEWAFAGFNSSSIYEYLKKDEIERVLLHAQQGSAPAAHQAWVLIVFSEWLKKWNL